MSLLAVLTDFTGCRRERGERERRQRCDRTCLMWSYWARSGCGRCGFVPRKTEYYI
jgi:hypothetical protein